MTRLFRFLTTFLITLAAVAVFGILSTGVASAHVEVSPGTAVGGTETQLTFRAPNEMATAHFTKLVIHLPAAHPLASIATRPVPGWTVSVTKAPLPKPVTTDGGTATEYTSTITWTATGGGVGPGQYEDFDISAGPLPGSGTMTFDADQTYSDGSVVHWNQVVQPGASEPEHPAPTLTLTAAAASSGSSDGVARGLGIAGTVVGAIGLVAAALAFRRGRRVT